MPARARPLTPTCAPTDHGATTAPLLAPSARTADRAARILRAMGDPARVRLLAELAAGPRCVTELAEASGDGLPVVSQRLRVLRTEGLVQSQRDGKHVLYSLEDAHVLQLLVTVLAHAGEDRIAAL